MWCRSLETEPVRLVILFCICVLKSQLKNGLQKQLHSLYYILKMLEQALLSLSTVAALPQPSVCVETPTGSRKRCLMEETQDKSWGQTVTGSAAQIGVLLALPGSSRKNLTCKN